MIARTALTAAFWGCLQLPFPTNDRDSPRTFLPKTTQAGIINQPARATRFNDLGASAPTERNVLPTAANRR